jgi:hypothetical protein
MTPIIVGDTGYGPEDLWEDTFENYWVVMDEDGNEVPASELFPKRRNRKTRKASNGDQSVKAIAQELGYSADTIIKIFQNQKGVIRRTFSGRNRKKYTILKIPKAVVDRWRQEHTIR